MTQKTACTAGMLLALPTLALCILFAGCQIPQTEHSNGGITENNLEETAQRHSYRAYYVKRGDTLFSIGIRYGVSWQTIKKYNNTDESRLEVGQVLFIPIADRSSQGTGSTSSGSRPVGGEAGPGRPWIWPLEGYVTREYGSVLHGMPEPGVAITAPAGTQVRAVADGRVISVIQRPWYLESGWGNAVAIQHARNVVSWYALLDSVNVKEGARLRQGDMIGVIGMRGDAPPLLAFRLFENERPVNPSRFLP